MSHHGSWPYTLDMLIQNLYVHVLFYAILFSHFFPLKWLVPHFGIKCTQCVHMVCSGCGSKTVLISKAGIMERKGMSFWIAESLGEVRHVVY